MSPHEDRGVAMGRSLVRTARSFGVSEEGIALLARAHGLAMDPRVRFLDDDHHPAYLHPGRTSLVLLRDADVRDGVVLAAGSLLESRDASLRVELRRVRDDMGEDVAALMEAAPAPGSPGLAEALVTAPRTVCLLSLAEHLDHLRHLHVRGPEPDWGERLEEVEMVWLPVAHRAHPRLAGRYAHWARTFRKRLA